MTDTTIRTREHPPQLGLIGIGLLGTAIAERLLHAGRQVLGWDLSPGRCAELARLGGRAASSIAEVVSLCDRVLLSLPSHEVVAQVLGSAESALRTGQLIIDTSTGDPDAAATMEARLSQRGIEYLDATVSGSSVQLRDGQAVLLVGAKDSAFRACQDVFAQLAVKVFHTGPPGSGARMKLVTNLVLGLNRAALAEGLCLARRSAWTSSRLCSCCVRAWPTRASWTRKERRWCGATSRRRHDSPNI